MILLDTNVVSEPMRPVPLRSVLDWLDRQERNSLHVSAVTIFELRRGAQGLAAGRRRTGLLAAVEGVETVMCANRVVAFGAAEAAVAADLSVRRQMIGMPISQTDAIIAATAKHHGFTLATCNTRDFAHLGIDLVDPFG